MVPQYDVDEEMKKMRYHDMLMDDIREFVRFSRCKTLNDMTDKVCEWEIELEVWAKRKPE